MLSEQGADINAVTAEGRSALLYAASKGREKIVEYLLSKRADPNKADKLGATPLHRYNYYNSYNALIIKLSSPELQDLDTLMLSRCC